MSSALRSPRLSVTVSFSSTESPGPINDEQKRQLQRIRSSANHLLSIIDEILTLARMEAGKERVESARRGDTRRDGISCIDGRAARFSEGSAFRMDVEPAGTDSSHRSGKTAPGSAESSVECREIHRRGRDISNDRDCDGVVDFMVTDTGVGVSEDHLEKIFEPFWQVEQTTTRRAGGTGLGLAVTRQFVDLLGGSSCIEPAWSGEHISGFNTTKRKY